MVHYRQYHHKQPDTHNYSLFLQGTNEYTGAVVRTGLGMLYTSLYEIY